MYNTSTAASSGLSKINSAWAGSRPAIRAPRLLEPDFFNFTKPPRKFQAIPAVLGKDYFLHQPPDNGLPINE